MPQLAKPAAPRTGPARRWLGRLGRRCCRCCRYYGILFIAVVCILLYIIFYSIEYVILISLFYFYIIFIIGGRGWYLVVGGGRRWTGGRWWTNTFQVLSKFSFYRSCLDHAQTIAAVFQGGSKQRKPNNDDKHGHGQEKRRSSTLC